MALQNSGEINRILIIEDSLLSHQIFRNILGGSYVLAHATTGRQGVQLLAQFRPNLIVLDLTLPDVDGFELLKELRQSELAQGVPVIIVSSSNNEQDEEKGFMLGAVDYIRKNFCNAVVKARVNTQFKILHQIRIIEEMSLVDGLTGIGNRRAFDSFLQYEWARGLRDEAPLSMMLLDVDHFKEYNDTYGHMQGDLMLKAIGQMLTKVAGRSTDIQCRYGGEEFVVLLPNTELLDACRIAERVRAAVEEMAVPCLHLQCTTGGTVSVGVAETVPKIQIPDSCFVLLADKMLYRAKSGGRNRVEGMELHADMVPALLGGADSLESRRGDCREERTACGNDPAVAVKEGN